MPDSERTDIDAVKSALGEHSQTRVGDDLAVLAIRLYSRPWIESWCQTRTAQAGVKLAHGGSLLRCMALDFKGTAPARLSVIKGGLHAR